LISPRRRDIICPMHPGSQRPKLRLYLLLVAIQITGAIAFVWQQLPEFEQVVINPGKQLPHDAFSDLVTVGVFCLMQLAFWCRLLYVPIPFRRPSVLLSHLLLFLGRLSFIFGSALFSVAVFRHLPELGRRRTSRSRPGAASSLWRACSRCSVSASSWSGWARL
jgi:hypothetical protein